MWRWKLLEQIRPIEEQIQTRQELIKQYEELIQQQEESLIKLLEEVKPIALKIMEHGIWFTHPSIDLRIVKGPILADKDDEGYYTYYDLKDGKVMKKLYGVDDEKQVTWFHLIHSGNYKQAAEGLNYVKTMVEEYNNNISEQIRNGLALIEQYK